MLAVAQVKVWLAGIDFHPCAWGQSRVTKGDIGDAKKGAQTDAIKKALSYFSIGNRAYYGLLQKGGNGK
jgi:recombination DNA repair RAD52 pathway protein